MVEVTVEDVVVRAPKDEEAWLASGKALVWLRAVGEGVFRPSWSGLPMPSDVPLL